MVDDIEHPCPACGRDRDAKEPQEEARRLYREHGGKRETPNPGGRALYFEGLGRLQLSDQCNWCDLESIRRFIDRGGEPESPFTGEGPDPDWVEDYSEDNPVVALRRPLKGAPEMIDEGSFREAADYCAEEVGE